MIVTTDQGDTEVNLIIFLKIVLRALKLSINLISFQKLIKNLFCNVIFLVIVYYRLRNVRGRLDMLESEMMFTIWDT